jgi:hypothetical protein
MWRVRKHLPLDTQPILHKAPVISYVQSCHYLGRATTVSNSFAITGRLSSVPMSDAFVSMADTPGMNGDAHPGPRGPT